MIWKKKEYRKECVSRAENGGARACFCALLKIKMEPLGLTQRERLTDAAHMSARTKRVSHWRRKKAAYSVRFMTQIDREIYETLRRAAQERE